MGLSSLIAEVSSYVDGYKSWNCWVSYGLWTVTRLHEKYFDSLRNFFFFNKTETVVLQESGYKHTFSSLLLIYFPVSNHFFFPIVKWKSFSRVQLCKPMDYTVYGILQARILKRIAFPFSRGHSQCRVWTQVSHITGGFFTNWATREVLFFLIRCMWIKVETTDNKTQNILGRKQQHKPANMAEPFVMLIPIKVLQHSLSYFFIFMVDRKHEIKYYITRENT